MVRGLGEDAVMRFRVAVVRKERLEYVVEARTKDEAEDMVYSTLGSVPAEREPETVTQLVAPFVQSVVRES